MKLLALLIPLARLAGGFWQFDDRDKWTQLELLRAEQGRQDASLAEHLRKKPPVSEERIANLEKEMAAWRSGPSQLRPTPEQFPPRYLQWLEKRVAERSRLNRDDSFRIIFVKPHFWGGCFPCWTFKMELTGRYTTLVDFLQDHRRPQLPWVNVVQKIALKRGVSAQTISMVTQPYFIP